MFWSPRLRSQTGVGPENRVPRRVRGGDSCLMWSCRILERGIELKKALHEWRENVGGKATFFNGKIDGWMYERVMGK